MLYSFSNDIFDNLDQNSTELLDKIWFISKEKHFLFIKNEDDLTIIKNSDWYKGLRKSSQEQINLQLKNSIFINKNKSKLIISLSDKNAYSLVEALAILEEPLIVILEHIEYDKYFIDALINNFIGGERLKEYYNRGWLKYTNGGGNNIPNVLRVMKDRFDKNKSDFPKNSAFYTRTFVIIDSDKKYPSTDGVEVAINKNDLLQSIKRDSAYHVTLKREMENYLPDEVFREIVDNEGFKQAYIRLRPEQKDFFDIQKGFPNKNFNQLDDNIRNLYDDISDDDKKTFRKQQLEFFKEDGRKANFKASFPKLFQSSNISQANLKARAKSTDENELEIILQKINDLL